MIYVHTKNDVTLVDDVKKVTINGSEKNFYSFTTKYCSHHRPLEFPIYDLIVKKRYRIADAFRGDKK